ncbi:MAG TPA: radical SAM protein [Tepidiformaceae bacterium]|nr:radical SAM protein [Tepidiformaceae bacterium]
MRTEFREEPCKTALTSVKGMRFGWSLNPYMGCAHRCVFCYVRAFERRADRPWDERYGTSIRVKTNVAEVLGHELSKRSWKRESVTIGSATDPYQPAEGTYRLTRKCIEVFARKRTPFAIITRGPMIVRDIDVLQDAALRAGAKVSFSIPTLDAEAWRLTEPGTAPPEQRLRVLERLVAVGIDAGVSIAPVLPGISDRPSQIDAVVRAAREAGATHLWTGMLHLGPGIREHFMESLARNWPELVPRYERMYTRDYVSRKESRGLDTLVDALEARYGVADRRERPLVAPPPERQLVLV